MRLSTISIALIFVLAGCSSAEKEMLNEVKDRLKDPESARFSQVHLKKSERGHRTIMCGLVNAKNGYGGYGESQPFTAIRVEATKSITVSFDSACETASINADMMDTLDYAREVLDKNK
jgi:hypothetical protein